MAAVMVLLITWRVALAVLEAVEAQTIKLAVLLHLDKVIMVVRAVQTLLFIAQAVAAALVLLVEQEIAAVLLEAVEMEPQIACLAVASLMLVAVGEVTQTAQAELRVVAEQAEVVRVA
jgi:hypothetical protein